jgi:phage tail tape-measure protein
MPAVHADPHRSAWALRTPLCRLFSRRERVAARSAIHGTTRIGRRSMSPLPGTTIVGRGAATAGRAVAGATAGAATVGAKAVGAATSGGATVAGGALVAKGTEPGAANVVGGA